MSRLKQVRIGDLYVDSEGMAHDVKNVKFTSCVDGYVNDGKSFHYFGKRNRLKRPEPEDTQERIDADAAKEPCEYFGWEERPGCHDNGGECPALNAMGRCRTTMTRDLLRRQRELDAKDAWNRRADEKEER